MDPNSVPLESSKSKVSIDPSSLQHLDQKTGNLEGRVVSQAKHQLPFKPSASAPLPDQKKSFLEQHDFTYRAVPPEMRAIEDQIVQDMTSLFAPEITEASPHAISRKDYQHQMSLALNLIGTQFETALESVHSEDQVTKQEEKAFIKTVTNALIHSKTKKGLIKALQSNKKISETFLQGLAEQLHHNKADILLLRLTSLDYAKKYQEAIPLAQKWHSTLNVNSNVDPNTHAITVSFAQFRKALELFNKEFGWMIQSATSERDKKLTTHLLATLLCGQAAPSLKELPEDHCCFVVKEFANTSSLLFETPLQDGESALLEQLVGVGENRTISAQNFSIFLTRFVGDNIERVGQEVLLGSKSYQMGFQTKSDLKKPFFMEDMAHQFLEYLLRHPKKVKELSQSQLLKKVEEVFGKNFLTQIFATVDMKQSGELGSVAKEAVQRILTCSEFSDEQESKIKQANLDSDEIKRLVDLKILEMAILINQTIKNNLVSKFAELIDKDNKPYMVILSEKKLTFGINPSNFDAFNTTGTLYFQLPFHSRPSDMILNPFLPNQTLIPAQIDTAYTIPSIEGTSHDNHQNLPTQTFSKLTFSPFTSISLIDHLVALLDRGRKMTLEAETTSIITDLKNIKDTFEDVTGTVSLAKFKMAHTHLNTLERLHLTGNIEEKQFKKMQMSLQEEVKQAWKKTKAQSSKVQTAQAQLEMIQKIFPELK